MNTEQAKMIDSQEFIEHLNVKSRWNRILLCDLVIVYDGKEIKLSEKQVEFYSTKGLNNIHIVEDCSSEFIQFINDNFWELI